jgi:hypothetical protein
MNLYLKTELGYLKNSTKTFSTDKLLNKRANIEIKDYAIIENKLQKQQQPPPHSIRRPQPLRCTSSGPNGFDPCCLDRWWM